MINKYIKSNKGITIIGLVITVILLLILTGAAIYNVNLSNNKSYYNKMVADIELLSGETLVYYNKYNERPKNERTIIIDKVKYW